MKRMGLIVSLEAFWVVSERVGSGYTAQRNSSNSRVGATTGLASRWLSRGWTSPTVLGPTARPDSGSPVVVPQQAAEARCAIA